MKPKSLILIVIACGCGLVASIGISQVMDRGGGEVETTKILVALNDININDKLDAQNIKLEDWPKDRLPEGTLVSLDDVKDKFSGARLYKGEPILQAKLTTSQGKNTTIPAGYRVVPVRVEAGVITELVQPGDRVDVLVFMHKNSEIPVTGTKTVLTDVRIWAVNDQTERANEKDSETIQARTVSVLVKPGQVEMLMLAMELGKVKLSLRRADDKTIVELNNGTSISQLFSKPGQSATDPTPEAPKSTFADFLKDKASPAPHTPTPVEAPVVVASGPRKRMVVHTPDGVKLYQWNNPDELPEVISLGEGGAPATAPALPAPTPTPSNDNQGDGQKNGPLEPDSDDKN